MVVVQAPTGRREALARRSACNDVARREHYLLPEVETLDVGTNARPIRVNRRRGIVIRDEDIEACLGEAERQAAGTGEEINERRARPNDREPRLHPHRGPAYGAAMTDSRELID
jgi:hypothetical protein